MGLLGTDLTDDIVDERPPTGPRARPGDILIQGIMDLQMHPGTSAIVGIAALVLAFWSATGYIGAFMRAANAIFDVPEGRPVWKTIPIQLVVTAITGLLFAASALAVVFTGRLASGPGTRSGSKRPLWTSSTS